MRAVDFLKDEQQVISRVLAALALATTGAGHGKSVQPDFFVQTSIFIQGFIEGVHFRKEDVFFKLLENHGMPLQYSSLGSMLHEQTQCRELSKSFSAAAKGWKDGDETARADVIWAASGYGRTLRQLIDRENSILFALFDQTASDEEKRLMSEAFKRMNEQKIEGKSIDDYKKLADEIEYESREYRV